MYTQYCNTFGFINQVTLSYFFLFFSILRNYDDYVKESLTINTHKYCEYNIYTY